MQDTYDRHQLKVNPSLFFLCESVPDMRHLEGSYSRILACSCGEPAGASSTTSRRIQADLDESSDMGVESVVDVVDEDGSLGSETCSNEDDEDASPHDV